MIVQQFIIARTMHGDDTSREHACQQNQMSCKAQQCEPAEPLASVPGADSAMHYRLGASGWLQDPHWCMSANIVNERSFHSPPPPANGSWRSWYTNVDGTSTSKWSVQRACARIACTVRLQLTHFSSYIGSRSNQVYPHK